MAKRWQKTERKDAKTFGARQTPRSGGLWFAKGDSKDDKFLIDSKDTQHESFTVTTKIWKKLEKEALLSNRAGLLVLTVGKERIKLVVMSEADFMTNVKESHLPEGCEWCDDCEGSGYHKIWTK